MNNQGYKSVSVEQLIPLEEIPDGAATLATTTATTTSTTTLEEERLPRSVKNFTFGKNTFAQATVVSCFWNKMGFFTILSIVFAIVLVSIDTTFFSMKMANKIGFNMNDPRFKRPLISGNDECETVLTGNTKYYWLWSFVVSIYFFLGVVRADLYELWKNTWISTLQTIFDMSMCIFGTCLNSVLTRQLQLLWGGPKPYFMKMCKLIGVQTPLLESTGFIYGFEYENYTCNVGGRSVWFHYEALKSTPDYITSTMFFPIFFVTFELFRRDKWNALPWKGMFSLLVACMTIIELFPLGAFVIGKEIECNWAFPNDIIISMIISFFFALLVQYKKNSLSEKYRYFVRN